MQAAEGGVPRRQTRPRGHLFRTESSVNKHLILERSEVRLAATEDQPLPAVILGEIFEKFRVSRRRSLHTSSNSANFRQLCSRRRLRLGNPSVPHSVLNSH